MKKQEIIKIIKECNDKLICIDLDGVLSFGEWWGPHNEDSLPNHKMIIKVWELYNKGAHIIIYTARQPSFYNETYAWLIKHKVPFHGISMFCKPGADIKITQKDDLLKALNIVIKK